MMYRECIYNYRSYYGGGIVYMHAADVVFMIAAVYVDANVPQIEEAYTYKWDKIGFTYESGISGGVAPVIVNYNNGIYVEKNT